MADNLITALPPEVRGEYLKSCEGMTPTAMRLAFGLSDLAAAEDDESDTPGLFKPTTPVGRQALEMAERATRAWQSIHQAHWASAADATVDKRAAFLRSAQHAEAELGKVDAEYDRLLNLVDERSANLATILGNACKPPSSVGDAQVDAEVRAMIRAETDPSKAMAIASAHPRAVATLPEAVAALLVGSSGYRTLRRTHLQAAAPAALAESDEVVRALDVMRKAHGELNKRTRRMIDFETAKRMAQHAGWRPPVTA